ncbi:MAG TPA: GNAT family N-acetyltransferase [Candidatus Ozemobacteraceae bacterium]|nr:GNAT family N-acetyltransferase [Candidatus Ozemobacteraceae bacterium]
MNIEIVQVTTNEQWHAALQIREDVFVREQQVPLELERDAIDEQAQHILALVTNLSQTPATGNNPGANGAPVWAGTARAFRNPECGEELMIGRVAVRKPFRRLGIAGKMTNWLIDWARSGGYQRVRLHAQSYIVRLYARLGFVTHGAEFLEAGIPHQEMILKL